MKSSTQETTGVSVLIPLRNTRPTWIRESIDSVLAQTHKNFEIIIVDDQSQNKETLDELQKIKKENPDRCFIFRSENHVGVAAALNLGLTKCNYDLIARMDSDDVIFPTRLELQTKYMENNPQVDILGAQLIAYNTALTYPLMTTSHPHVITKHTPLKTHWFVNHATTMYRKKRILDIGGYGNLKGYAEDIDLWLRCLEKGYVIRNLPDIVYKYRSSPGQVTKSGFKPDKPRWMARLLKTYRDKLI